MRRRIFEFRETDRLATGLTTASFISMVIAAIFYFSGGNLILIGPYVGYPHYTAWFIFFLLLGIILFLLGHCLRKVCDDVSNQLKLLEDDIKKKIDNLKNE